MGSRESDSTPGSGRREGPEAGLKNMGGSHAAGAPLSRLPAGGSGARPGQRCARGREPLGFALALVDAAVDTMQLTVKALQGRECSLQVRSPLQAATLTYSCRWGPMAGGGGRES